MSISNELIDQLMDGATDPEDLLGKEGLLQELTKRITERALQSEMDHHVGYAKNEVAGNGSGNSRNGTSSKTVRSVHGEIELDIPRDRNATFEPKLVKKGERQLGGFDQRIVSLYARGMTTRDIRQHFEEAYGVDVSAAFVSQVTNAVKEEVTAWQSRPLDAVYPIVYLDALMVRSRESGPVKNKAVYLALGVNLEGRKELLGLWLSGNEGAKFWLSVVTELKNRGVEDILIACTDGLKGFPEAIESVFPNTNIQLCIVHQIRHSLKFVSWKHRKAVAVDLKLIYTAETREQAENALTEFADKWDKQYPMISQSWLQHWERLSVFYDFSPEIRKVIYTTNAIESLNASMRKVIKNRRSFPNDESILKLMYLALHNISKRWTMPIQNWRQALGQFMIHFEGRINL